MATRALMLVAALSTAAAVAASVALPGSAAPSRPTPRPAAVAAVAVDGEARAWNATRRWIALAEVTAVRGSRAARRVATRRPRLAVRVAPGTVIAVVDGDGLRRRIAPTAVFAELRRASGPVLVEASGRIALARGRTARPPLAARRVVVRLPPPPQGDVPTAEGLAEDLADPESPTDEEGVPDDFLVDDGGVVDPDDPALGD